MHQSRRRLAVISAATGVLVIGMASLAAAATGSSNPVKAPKQIQIETTIVDDSSTTAVTVSVPSSSDPSTSAPADTVSTIADDSTSVPGGSVPGSVPSSSDPSTSVDDHGSGGHGADDGPGHDVGDDHGGDRDDSSSDDGPDHDAGDDHGGDRDDDDSDDDSSGSGKGGNGGGNDDGADHDAGDDHGGGGHGSDD